jgi:4-oxalomesaconate tautomerase
MTNVPLPASRERAIPCVLMRGGTSKAAFFRAEDLPADRPTRDRWLLAAMGHGDARQVDGLGGGHPLTTKVAIVSRSADPRADVDYLFAQIVATESRVDTAPTCGNILAGVGPFAIEQGLVAADPGETAVRIRMVNTESSCTAIVQTPGGHVTYGGDTRISGVSGGAAPVLLRFSDIAGSSCGALLPTGRTRDLIEGVPVTCIDNGMPVLLIQAASLGVSGYESPAELDANAALKARIEAIRLVAGPAMGLGDVRNKVVPKVTLVAPAVDGGAVHTRTFIPKVCHEAIGVLGAVSVATACLLEGSVAAEFVAPSPTRVRDLSVEHPSGEFTVRLELDERSGAVASAALLRTARALFRGEVLIQESES